MIPTSTYSVRFASAAKGDTITVLDPSGATVGIVAVLDQYGTADTLQLVPGETYTFTHAPSGKTGSFVAGASQLIPLAAGSGSSGGSGDPVLVEVFGVNSAVVSTSNGLITGGTVFQDFLTTGACGYDPATGRLSIPLNFATAPAGVALWRVEMSVEIALVLGASDPGDVFVDLHTMTIPGGATADVLDWNAWSPSVRKGTTTPLRVTGRASAHIKATTTGTSWDPNLALTAETPANFSGATVSSMLFDVKVLPVRLQGAQHL